MFNQIMDFIMKELEHCYVQVDWTGPTLSKYFLVYKRMVLTPSRIKAKLRSGEMAVSGDQWPIFVYQGYTYDPEDPWNGLLRSTILVSVSSLFDYIYRLCIDCL